MVSGTKAAVIDTGFLYALFDKKDQYHIEAASKSSLVEKLPVAIPWPCLYETLNSTFLKNKIQIKRFELLLKRPDVIFIDDREYRDGAYHLTIEWGSQGKRTISLVDMVTRLMIEDPRLRIGYLFTFDPGHFVDVCRKRKIEMLCQNRDRE
jgi:predicted nucleic acid-binding protein